MVYLENNISSQIRGAKDFVGRAASHFGAVVTTCSREPIGNQFCKSPPCFWLQRWRRVLSPDIVKLSGPDWSPLQVVTTDPKCDTKLATMSFAPPIWLKILFTRWPERRNKLKILDFLRNIFILYPQRGGKRYFSLRVKARICYKC